MLYMFFLLLYALVPLQGKLEDHFKPALYKYYDQKIRNIDFIYLINLDERPEKWKSCQKALSVYNIHPYRFSAVNGWNLSLEALNDVGVVYTKDMKGGEWASCFLPQNAGKRSEELVSTPGRTYFAHGISQGSIGIVLSHLSILQDAYNSGYSTIWVMEDDITVQYNPRMLSHIIDDLDGTVGSGNWDILFTDQDSKDFGGHYIPCHSYAWRPNFTPLETITGKKRRVGSFLKTQARYGAYSMIIRRSGMEKLLRFFSTYNIYLPYDIDFSVVPDIQLYTVIDDIVSTEPRALSDNASPNFLRKNI